MQNSRIPLVDLNAQYLSIRKEILEKIEEVLDSKAFIQGKYVKEFEQVYSELHENRFSVGCSNGTSAIALALWAVGVGSGDEVITVPNTFVATAEAINHVGAKPVFVDIDSETYSLDVSKLEAAITSKTKAILPVHLYGNPVDLDPLIKIAKEHNLFVIEDAAQAHFAIYKNKTVGCFGDLATFSFYPGKNLGAYGDAGLVLCKSKEQEKRIRYLVDHGRIDSKYEHAVVGHNFRLDGIQAAVLTVKLKHIAEWTRRRRINASIYDHLFSRLGIKFVKPTVESHPAYHLYVIEVSNRDETLAFLKRKGIAAGIHYPIPVHLQPAFSYLGYHKGSFPIAERTAGRILSLPIFPELSEENIRFIVEQVQSVAKP